MADKSNSKRGTFSWVLPSIFAVGAVTVAAAFFESQNVENALTQKALKAADAVGAKWANIQFIGRDATLNGISGDKQEIDQVVEKVKEITGVRRLAQFVELAPAMTPYKFEGRIDGDKIIFVGGVPSGQVRNELFGALDQANVTDDTQLRSAHPELEDWTPLAKQAIEALNNLSLGSFVLTDLELVLEGEAKSEDAFLELSSLDIDGLQIDIKPPFEAEYSWQMARDENGAEISGFIPDLELRKSISQALGAYGEVKDETTLASGAPLHTDDQLRFASEQLAFLNPGKVMWTAEGLAIEGETTSIDARRKLEAAIADASDEIKILKVEVLDPTISPYSLTFNKSADGQIDVEGYAPSDFARDALASDKSNVDGVEIARGAPENYAEMATFAQKLLSELESGAVQIVDGDISLSGQAANVEAFNALSQLQSEAPEGVELSADKVSPPKVDAYQFAATKSEDNQIQIIGYAPNVAVRAELTARENVSGTLDLAGGAPESFEEDVSLLFDKLALLKQGRFEFDDGGWILEGIAEKPQDYQSLIQSDDALTTSGRLRVSIEAARVEAYAFTARKQGDTSVLEGFIPSDSVDEIIAPLGENVENNTLVALGEPAGFSQTISVGLKALAQLDDGTLNLDENGWSFKGTVADFSIKQNILTQLSALPGAPEGWDIDVTSPPQVLDNYAFKLEKKLGELTLSGFVPSEALADRFKQDDELNADALELALGAPEDFDAHIELGFTSLNALDEGVFSFENGKWALNGQTDKFAKKQALLGSYESEENASLVALWQVDIGAPAPVDPYLFSIALEGDTLALTGYVPEAVLKNKLLKEAEGVGEKSIDDQLAFGEGAPLNFEDQVLGALKLASNLHDGEVALTEDGWQVRGRVARETGMEQFAALIAGEPEIFNGFNVDIAPPPPTCSEFVTRFGERGILRVDGKASDIKPGKHELIDSLLTYALQCADSQISIEGHTHDQGEARDNLVHTVRQADAIVNYLVSNGVSPSRLVSVGYGENLPLVPNSSRAGRATNQRIEIKITENTPVGADANAVETGEAGS